MTAALRDAIRASIRENRTVTLSPDTTEEEAALLDELASFVGYEDSAEVSGDGCSGHEARGYTDAWGDGWRLNVVHAEASAVDVRELDGTGIPWGTPWWTVRTRGA